MHRRLSLYSRISPQEGRHVGVLREVGIIPAAGANPLAMYDESRKFHKKRFHQD